MGETDIGLIGIAVAVFLILLDLPVGFSFLFTGILGLIFMNGLSATLHTIGSTAFQWASDYTFAAIPLFLIMGEFAHTSGISEDLFEFGQRVLGRIHGGLAMATICACGGFAALSGSSLATAAAMGGVSLPQMRRIGYNISVATGTIAAGGTLGILIPPSIPFCHHRDTYRHLHLTVTHSRHFARHYDGLYLLFGFVCFVQDQA